jgi:MinD-like ATPase involved in chromosome partitioning or flagellar assembly
MNNRGRDRGILQQSAQAPVRRGLPPRRRSTPGQPVRRAPELPTPPWPYGPDRPGWQPPAAGVPAERAKTPVAVGPPRLPEGVGLDSLEDQHTDVPTKFSWRGLLSRLPGIDLGPDKDQAYELELRDRIRASVGSAFPIAVLNLKGGVGKTTVVEALGSTFAEARTDRVIAVDLDAGDLGYRHGRQNPSTMVDLLADRSVARYPDVRAHTNRNAAGLEVLGLPDYAQSDWLLARDDVVKAFSIVRNHYSVVLMDCGKTLKSSVMEAVLSDSRALVVVTSTSVEAIKTTRTTLQWLVRNGYQKRIESTVLAINHTEREKPNAWVNRGLQQLSKRLNPKHVVELPFDDHVHEGNEITLERLSKQSRRGYLEMAAALADMFPRRDVGRRLM